MGTFTLLVAFRPLPPTASLSYSPACFGACLTPRQEASTFYYLSLSFSLQAEEAGAGGGMWYWE